MIVTREQYDRMAKFGKPLMVERKSRVTAEPVEFGNLNDPGGERIQQPMVIGCGLKVGDVREFHWRELPDDWKRGKPLPPARDGLLATVTHLEQIDDENWRVTFERGAKLPDEVRLLKRGGGYTGDDSLAVEDGGCAVPDAYHKQLAKDAEPVGEVLRDQRRFEAKREWDAMIAGIRRQIDEFPDGNDAEVRRLKRKASRLLRERDAA